MSLQTYNVFTNIRNFSTNTRKFLQIQENFHKYKKFFTNITNFSQI
jgi:hypothetical protein